MQKVVINLAFGKRRRRCSAAKFFD